MKTTHPKPIVVVPRDTPKIEIEEPRKRGYIPLLCDDPSKVVILSPRTAVQPEDLMMSALGAIVGSNSSAERERFVGELYRRLKEREDKA